MDPVPLPFVVSQDSTFTTADDDDVDISAPSEALMKRQFTMHIFINAGEGDKGGGYTALVCKGKTQKKKAVEMKQAWHKDGVPMHFQQNA
jgi:hypothetical protein